MCSYNVCLLIAVADTLEVCIDVCAVLDCPIHSMEYRLGFAHAYDTDSYLPWPDVWLEAAKGLKDMIIIYDDFSEYTLNRKRKYWIESNIYQEMLNNEH